MAVACGATLMAVAIVLDLVGRPIASWVVFALIVILALWDASRDDYAAHGS